MPSATKLAEALPIELTSHIVGGPDSNRHPPPRTPDTTRTCMCPLLFQLVRSQRRYWGMNCIQLSSPGGGNRTHSTSSQMRRAASTLHPVNLLRSPSWIRTNNPLVQSQVQLPIVLPGNKYRCQTSVLPRRDCFRCYSTYGTSVELRPQLNCLTSSHTWIRTKIHRLTVGCSALELCGIESG